MSSIPMHIKQKYEGSQQGNTIISCGCFRIFKSADSVPLYAPGQISRDEKYIRTSIANRNLHRLTESFNRRLQEESFCLRDLNISSQVDVGPDGGVIRRGLGCVRHRLVVGEQDVVFASPYSHRQMPPAVTCPPFADEARRVRGGRLFCGPRPDSFPTPLPSKGAASQYLNT